MTKSEALQQIYRTHGKLTPELVVEHAEDPESPLHDHFDWDNREAGDKWRKHQARMLICNVKIVSETNPDEKTRLFIHNGERDESRQYDHVNVVVNDPGEFIKTLNRFKEDCLSYINRIKSLGEYKRHESRAGTQLANIERSLDTLISLYEPKEESEAA